MEAVKLNESDWELYQQYELAMVPENNFITVTQTAKVFVHMELFECARAREGLQSSYFLMYENVSAKQGTNDLTKCELNQLVNTEDFSFSSKNEHAKDYANFKQHTMCNEIQIGQQVACHFLGIRLGMVEQANMISTIKKSLDVVSACLVICHFSCTGSFIVSTILPDHFLCL